MISIMRFHRALERERGYIRRNELETDYWRGVLRGLQMAWQVAYRLWQDKKTREGLSV